MQLFPELAGTHNQAPADPSFLKSQVDKYYVHIIGEECNGIHPMKGRVPGRDSIRMRSNDYLCIAHHPKLVEAEIESLTKFGHGDSISRCFIHHYDDPLSSFEQRLARLMQAEAAVLANSGYGANVAVVQAIAKDGTPVYIDMKAHVSLWEGIRSGGGKLVPVRHNDLDHLDRMIQIHGPGVVVVDAVYSLDGDICPLRAMLDVVERRGCAIIVDETHSFGAMGPDGAGLVVSEDLAPRVHFRTVGLSKAVACRGGAIVCSAHNAEYIRYQSIQAIFSTTVLRHEVAGYNAALDIFATETWRQNRLRANHAWLKSELSQIGFNVEASKAQIISLEAGDIQVTTQLRDRLERQGVFGAIFMPPATSQKRCLMRFTVNCGLTDAELRRVVEVCAEIYRDMNAANWASTKRKISLAKSSIPTEAIAA